MADINRQNWNRQFKILQDTWPKAVNFEKCIGICLDLHAMVHTSELANSGLWSYEDELWEGMSEDTFRRVYAGDQSIAWKLWHSARIEDITMNILIAGQEQVFKEGDWYRKLNVAAYDTGNAMNETEIGLLGKTINRQALYEYRLEVARKTRSIIKALTPEDLKHKTEPSRLKRILDEGAVVEQARGVVNYWSKKTYAGLLLMPATRHNFVHLNEATRLKAKKG